MGAYVGQRIATLVAGGSLPGPFTYHHQGDLATIGRKSAIVSIGRIKLTGFVGWLFWCLVHIMFLIGFRTRLVVSINWFWGFVTLQRSVRLISDGSPRSAVKAPAPPSWAPLRSSLDIPWRQTWPRRSLTSSPTTSSHSDLTA
jgi:NADH dehydrogenase